MCGRFVQDIAPELLATVYNLTSVPQLPPRYNIAPSQLVAAVRQTGGSGRELTLLQWGLIPSWSKDPAIGHKLINARSETAHEKPSFRQALRTRRCIIPAGGFYEWQRQGQEKQPYYIRRRDGEPLALAGLWERWSPPDGAPLETCTILTTNANPLVRELHERMPVLLHRQEFDLWLERDIDDPRRLAELYRPYPADLLESYAVSREVSSPGNDGPVCIVPL